MWTSLSILKNEKSTRVQRIIIGRKTFITKIFDLGFWHTVSVFLRNKVKGPRNWRLQLYTNYHLSVGGILIHLLPTILLTWRLCLNLSRTKTLNVYTHTRECVCVRIFPCIIGPLVSGIPSSCSDFHYRNPSFFVDYGKRKYDWGSKSPPPIQYGCWVETYPLRPWPTLLLLYRNDLSLFWRLVPMWVVYMSHMLTLFRDPNLRDLVRCYKN